MRKVSIRVPRVQHLIVRSMRVCVHVWQFVSYFVCLHVLLAISLCMRRICARVSLAAPMQLPNGSSRLPLVVHLLRPATTVVSAAVMWCVSVVNACIQAIRHQRGSLIGHLFLGPPNHVCEPRTHLTNWDTYSTSFPKLSGL